MHLPIIKYEHEVLDIKDEGLKKRDFDALIGLNNQHGNKYFTIEPNGIRFKQYVGVIQLNERTIEIRPKADKNNDSATKNKWRNVLVQMLEQCGRVRINPYENAQLEKGSLNLLELYFDQYLSEVQLLIRNGLIKQYRKEASNVKALKGKLDFAQNIRHNLVHKERFFTIHQVYDVDHRIHQILTQAIDIVKQFSTNMWINDKCRRIQLEFPEVKKIQATKQLLDSIQLNRKTAPYERALELARLIILNYSPNISQGEEKMISILFNMNQLWEEYVLTRLRQASRDYPSIKVLGKQVKTFWGSNRLEPDIVIEKGGETYIIDTKWKTPGTSTSVQDLRQMYAYGRFWNAQKIMLLYPGDTGTDGFKSFEKKEHIQKSETEFDFKAHQCMKGFVSVLKKEKAEKDILDEDIGIRIFEMLKLIE